MKPLNWHTTNSLMFNPHKSKVDKQVSIDMQELAREKSRDIEKLSRKRIWLP